MKRIFRKLLALTLSMAMIMQTVSISTFAVEKKSFDKELMDIKSKGFITGEILDVTENKNGIIFSVKYLTSGETSYITYLEEDEKTTIIITEGERTNKITYKVDGQVFVDGKRYTDFEVSNKAMKRSQYASAFFDGLPPGCSGANFTGNGSVTDYVALGSGIASHTANVLAMKIAAKMLLTSNPYGLFVLSAELLINHAISEGIIAMNLSYTLKQFKDTTKAPLQYFFKYESKFTLGSKIVNKTFYEVENLL